MLEAKHNPMSTQPVRLTRRLLIGGAGGVAAALTAGCSTNKNPSTSSGNVAGQAKAAKQPRPGGILNYGGGSNDTAGRSFDPTIQTQFADKTYTLFYERMLTYDLRSYKAGPELAQKWEQPSPTEYVFHLQPNVKWQDKPPVSARPLTADDVLYNLKRAGANDPRLFSRSLLTLIDKIEAVDTATVRITTKSPDASTFSKLSSELLEILAPEVVDKNPKLTTADAVIGTGPFIMKSVEQGVGAEYVRNPGYWKAGLPYLDGFRTKMIADLLTAWAAFLAGQTDIAVIPPSEIQKYVGQQGSGYTPDWFADDTTYVFFAPNVKKKPMDDARLARALRLLTDHDEFNKAWAETQYGRGSCGSILPTAFSAWDLSQQEYGQQLEWKQPKDAAAKEAVSLLNAAGFTTANPLKFTLDGRDGVAGGVALQLAQSEWKRLSGGIVDVQINQNTSAALDVIRSQHSFTYAIYGFSAGYGDPDAWLSTTYYTDGSLNFANFSDPKVDAMIDQQRTIFDDQQRKAAIKDIVIYMIDHGVTTIGANDSQLPVAKAKVQGYVPCNTLYGTEFQSVWLTA